MDSIYHLSLILHSYNRWLVFASLIAIIGWSIHQKNKNISFENRIPILQKTVLISLDFQITFGLILYYYSPIPSYFWKNLPETMKEREIRFFGLEHLTVMLIAAIIIHLGILKSTKKITDKEKYKTLIVWMVIGLILIISSIPWSFSPLINRPLFR